jgi:hypothetical protein
MTTIAFIVGIIVGASTVLLLATIALVDERKELIHELSDLKQRLYKLEAQIIKKGPVESR